MYAWTMQGAQKVIANWMTRYMQRSGINATDWAISAELHKSTVSRATKDKFESVTSIPTLHALAVAAGMPSVLDFLSAQAVELEYPDATIEILRQALPTIGCHLSDVDFNQLSTVMLAARSMIAKSEAAIRANPTYRKAIISAVIEKTNR